MVNLFKFRGTVLPWLLRRPLIWLSLVVYISATVCKQGYDDQCGKYLPEVEIKELGIMGSLLTFFLAFYTNACYSRFYEQYTHLKCIEGTMRSIAIQIRMFYHLPNLDNESYNKLYFNTMELLRYLGGTYYLLFARLYEGTDKTFDLDSAFKEEHLITEQEAKILSKSSPGMRWFRVLCWAIQIVQEMEAEGSLEKSKADKITNSILSMREQMNAVSYQAQMPVPFTYYHIITILCFSFILAYSYACAFVATHISLGWLIYLIPIFGFGGMREVAISLADPFGDDETDLPVHVYVRNIMRFLVTFIEEKLRPVDGQEKQNFHDGKHWAVRHSLNEETTKDRIASGKKEVLEANATGSQLSEPVWT